jgi:hypothetical protein
MICQTGLPRHPSSLALVCVEGDEIIIDSARDHVEASRGGLVLIREGDGLSGSLHQPLVKSRAIAFRLGIFGAA